MGVNSVNSFGDNFSRDDIREESAGRYTQSEEIFDFDTDSESVENAAEDYDEQQTARKQQFYKDYSAALTDAQRDTVVANYDYETKKADLIYDFSFVENPSDEDVMQFRAAMEYIEDSHQVDLFKIEQQERDDKYAIDYAQAKTDSERNLVTQKYNYETARAAIVFNFSRIENPTDEQREAYEQGLKDLDRQNNEAVYNINKQARDEQYTKDVVNAWSETDRAQITENYRRESARAELVFNFSNIENPTDAQREQFLAELSQYD